MLETESKQNRYTFIDLFAGAGGLSEGFIQAGFEPIAHVEMDKYAAQTIETRSAYYYLKEIGDINRYNRYLTGDISRNELLEAVPQEIKETVINKTMSEESLPSIFRTIDGIMKNKGISSVDVVVGGPPCQAYSLVGRAQSSHMGIPMEKDPRNHLYKLYVRFLKRYKPRMFVFENVTGIVTANKGTTWKNIRSYLKRVGYEIECREQNAVSFGVLQKRQRMIIVGWLKNSGLHYPDFLSQTHDAVVNDLLSDLPKLHPGESSSLYATSSCSDYLKTTGIRTEEDILTLHNSRPHQERDIQIYRIAIELWNNKHKHLNYNDLPDNLKTHKNRNSFVDRFKVVEGNEVQCHTILAHLSKDGHYFIHPDIEQCRSITVREAARIQSFPDSYFFEGPRTAQFVQVGNAVPPLMAKGIAFGINQQLEEGDISGEQSVT